MIKLALREHGRAAQCDDRINDQWSKAVAKPGSGESITNTGYLLDTVEGLVRMIGQYKGTMRILGYCVWN